LLLFSFGGHLDVLWFFRNGRREGFRSYRTPP
jgi:hypothetical protein